jgi:Fe-S cluster biogenesis protein NfuA
MTVGFQPGGWMNTQPLTDDELKARVQEILDGQVNPGIAGHGGMIELLDVRNNNIYVHMGGGCQGCRMANITLKNGVEAMLKEELPQIERVIDQTDHADGENPFYQP